MLLNEVKQLRKRILGEATTGRREVNASKLLKQLEDLGVDVVAGVRDEIVIQLAKLIDLIPNSAIYLIHKEVLAPVLVAISKFDTYPLKLKDLTPVMLKSISFKFKGDVKGVEYPDWVYNMLTTYNFFKWESLRGSQDALTFYNKNVKDLVNYLLVLGLGEGHLGESLTEGHLDEVLNKKVVLSMPEAMYKRLLAVGDKINKDVKEMVSDLMSKAYKDHKITKARFDNYYMSDKDVKVSLTVDEVYWYSWMYALLDAAGGRGSNRPLTAKDTKLLHTSILGALQNEYEGHI